MEDLSKAQIIFGFRYGYQHNLFFDFGINDDLPLGMAINQGRVGFGIGNEAFRLPGKWWLSSGIMKYNDSKTGAYLNAELMLGRRILVNPGIRFGKHPAVGLNVGTIF